MSEPVVTIYRCTKCKAEDKDRGVNPPAPLLLICWNCKAGKGITEEEMYANNFGMFPVTE